MLAGKWTYRSYRNDCGIVGNDAAAALAMIFGEGVLDLAQDGGEVRGALGLGLGHALKLTGDCHAAKRDEATGFSLIGDGIDGTPTAGWRYEYRGIVAPAWPEAVDRIPCLIGTVLRAKEHGPDAPAGVTASFVAVRRAEAPPAGSGRTFALLA